MTCDRCFKSLSDGDHGEGVCPYEPRRWGATVIDDQLPGGPRMFENLGDKEVYIETKSQLRAEIQARGLQPCVRHVGDKGSDKSPFTSRWI
jgi:hypothetical protein